MAKKTFPETPRGTRRRGKTSKRQVAPTAVSTKTFKENTMSGPARAVIMKVHMVNSSENLSNAIANQTPATREVYNVDGGGYLTRSPTKTSTRGYRMEADVKLIEGIGGFAESGTVIPRIPVALSFGGVENYSYVVPNGTTNGDFNGYTGKENGDYCLIQFIGGDFFNPIITNILPHRLNTSDAPDYGYDNTAFTRINGTVVFVDERGNFQLDATEAAEIRTTDPNTGAITTVQGDGIEGMIEVVTRNDISVVAGYTPDNKGEGIPKGAMSFVSSKDLKLLSQHQHASLTAQKTISLLSRDDESTINSEADGTLVKIQNIRGSLRPAARQNDKVKITSGNDGDLFEYLGILHNLLDKVGQSLLAASTDAGARAAGNLINAFIGSHARPTYQEGKIIEGSKYCKIAGEGTADDIGEDERGVCIVGEEDLSPEDRTKKLENLIDNNVADVTADLLTEVKDDISQNMLKTILPTLLNQIAEIMINFPPTIPYAKPVQLGSTIITYIMELLSSGGLEIPPGDSLELPETAKDLENFPNGIEILNGAEIPNNGSDIESFEALTGYDTNGDVAYGVDPNGNMPGHVDYIDTVIKNLVGAVGAVNILKTQIEDLIKALVPEDGWDVAIFEEQNTKPIIIHLSSPFVTVPPSLLWPDAEIIIIDPGDYPDLAEAENLFDALIDDPIYGVDALSGLLQHIMSGFDSIYLVGLGIPDGYTPGIPINGGNVEAAAVAAADAELVPCTPTTP